MKKKYILYLAIIIALVGLDQYTKYLATTYLEPVGTMPFIPGLELTYVVNDGVAFSLFSGSSLFVIIIPSITLVILLVLLFLNKLGGGMFDICFVIIIAGGIGNIIDRLLYGHVVDFFNFTFIDFAVFNVADTFITVGVALYAVIFVLSEIKAKKISKHGAENKDEDIVEND